MSKNGTTKKAPRKTATASKAVIAAKAIAWDKLFAHTTVSAMTHEDSADAVLDEPVAADLADDCKASFTAVIGPGIYTERVSFGKGAIIDWLLDTLRDVEYDSIEVCFGRYTQKMASQHSSVESKVGRITAFLWPYKGGKPATLADGTTPVDPFNLGDLKP